MKFILRIIVLESVLATILFGSAGRLDLPWFWALIAVHAVGMLTLGFGMDPGLRRERFRPGPGGGKDRNFRWVAAPVILAHLAVAGLDVGCFDWTGHVPVAAHAAGLLAYIAGFAFSLWAMLANPFFSPVVRIQQERGHRVISTGPYRFIRHPGYAGLLLAVTSESILLGSYWSLLPLLPLLPLLFLRVRNEDRFLRQNLPGYAEYAARVRTGLLPGVW